MSAFFYSLYYKFFALFTATLMLISPSFKKTVERVETDKQFQLTHIEELKNAYASGEKTAVDEDAIFNGNLEKALSDGVKLNNIAVIGTHNSYQRYHEGQSSGFCGLNNEKGMPITLSDQLDAGLRNLEIDVETVVDETGTHFVCMHSPLLDMATNCYSFEKALEEIAVWSDNNPGHLPITIIIEPKSVFIPLENMRFFSAEAANELDKTVRDALADRLLTPADTMGGFDSLKAMREADAWPEVRDILGRIIAVLHPCGATSDYIKQDETVKTQSMFPMVRPADKDKSYAAFLLVNDASALLSKYTGLADGNFMIRTRADLSGRYSASTFATAASTVANIISTDYPFLGSGDSGQYVAFDGNTAVKLTNTR